MSQSVNATRPDILLHLEALVFLTAGCIAYNRLYPGKWGLFALLFLVPDVSLLPYLLSKGLPAASIYNIFHSYVFPLALGLFAWTQQSVLAGEVSLIWMAHIGFDRALGYGLKYPGEFKHTHVQSAASA
jgi:hypothetical protein